METKPMYCNITNKEIISTLSWDCPIPIKLVSKFAGKIVEFDYDKEKI